MHPRSLSFFLSLFASLSVGCVPLPVDDDDDDSAAPDDDDSAGPDDDDSAEADDDDAAACESPFEFVPDLDVLVSSMGAWVDAEVLQWPPSAGPEFVVPELALDYPDGEVDLLVGSEGVGPHMADLDLESLGTIKLSGRVLDEGWREGTLAAATVDDELLFQVGYQPWPNLPAPQWGTVFGTVLGCPDAVQDIWDDEYRSTVVLTRGSDSLEMHPGEVREAFGLRFAVGAALDGQGGGPDEKSDPLWILITKLP
jgi:hypothetical protein